MAISPFIFDGNTSSPAELARKRALISQIMGSQRTPRNVGEGLNALGDGIVANVMGRRADRAESEGMSGANTLFDSIVSRLGGGGDFPPAPPAPGGGGSPYEVQAGPNTLSGSADPIGSVMSAAPDNASARVAEGHANGDWLRYANKGATRNMPLDPDLVKAMGFLPDLGVTMEVFSGGQPGKGSGLARIGSTRHDHGKAADAFFYKDGRKLDWSNPQDVPIFQEIVRRGRAAGITGFGAGPGYMQRGSMHIGFGPESVWGAGGKGANAPEWLRSAFTGGAQPQASQAALESLPQGGSMQVGPAPQQMAQAPMQQQPGQMNDMTMGAPPVQPGQGGGITIQELVRAASNPFLNDQQRAMVNMLLQQEMQKLDPMRQLDMDYKQAQTQKLQRELSGELGDQSKVQSSTILDDGTTVLVMNNGQRRVLSPTGDEVQGQQAADAVRKAREYTVENQREVYGGRREGTLRADTEFGGAAAGAVDVGKASVKAGVDAWNGYGKLQSSIGNIDEAIAAIDAGAKSGVIYSMLPSVTEASASLENAMNRMGLDVIGSVTFGALSEGEMRLAMDTAVPRGLQPEQLRSWLSKKREAQQKAAEMLGDAAQFLTVPGNTINDWIKKNRAANGGGQEPAADDLDKLLEMYGD